MRKPPIVIAAVAVMTMLCAKPVSAQELMPGTWSGTITPPGAQPLSVSFMVGRADGNLSIVMSEVSNGEMPFEDVVYDGSVLVFWWDAGVRVDCALRWAEGSLQGSCTDGRPGDEQGAMKMTPPGT